MTKYLQRGSRAKIQPKGWTEERRAHQAALTRAQQPWSHATGPKTAAGKAVCAANATTHGYDSRQSLQQRRSVRHALALAALNIERLRAFLRNSPRR
jgi:hypothetical protein